MAVFARTGSRASASPSNLHNAISKSRKERDRGGRCNFRDLNRGFQCGCLSFWKEVGSAAAREGDGMRCTCGHHVCFHHFEERRMERVQDPQPELVQEKSGAYVAFQEVGEDDDGDDALYHTNSESQLSNRLQRDDRERRKTRHEKTEREQQESRHELQDRIQQQRSQTGQMRQYSQLRQHPSQQEQNSQMRQQQSQLGRDSSRAASQRARLSHFNLRASDLSSNTGFPRIPSVCLLPEQSGTAELGDTAPISDSQYQRVRKSYAHPAGLGLSFGINDLGRDQREDSLPSTMQMAAPSEDDFPPIRPGSSASLRPTRASPSRSLMHNFFQPPRKLAPLTVPEEPQEATNPEDLAGSATEAATPSVRATPEIRQIEQTVLEAKSMADLLCRTLADRDSALPGSSNQLRSAQGLPGNQQSLSDSTTGSVVGLLQKLGVHLNSLHSHLSSYPSVSASLKTLADRIDSLENLSFSNVQAEEVAERFEFLDGRLLELESWKEDHDKIHSVMDSHENDSLYSDGLGRGSGPFAKIEDIEGINDRLDGLEAHVPTFSHPWALEVVFLPWGRDLRGIWYSPEDALEMKATPQDTEEWTKVRSNASASRLSSTDPRSSYSGWSEQDIHGWADNTDDWLSPKACGPKNVVYKRLQSRGFVRNVQITGSNAEDIQAALRTCFESLPYDPEITSSFSSQESDHMLNRVPGLRTSFVPLRKVLSSSRLQFLSRQEMATSALWTAQFLASGIMMRVSGGTKRLFVTHRDAYMQQSSKDTPWSWKQIQELPRFDPGLDVQTNVGPAQVIEADVDEPCWRYVPKLDQPPSMTSSFSSFHGKSASASQDIAGQTLEPQKFKLMPFQKSASQPHPVQSTSDFLETSTIRHPRSQYRPVSPSLADSAIASTPKRPESRQSFQKRRIASFGGVSQTTSHYVQDPMSSPIGKGKRRRMSSSSPTSEPPIPGARAFGYTPRSKGSSSKEGSSPFFEPAGPSNASEVVSPSGLMAAGTSKRSNPQHAYATPHSGPVLGAGMTDIATTDGGDTVVDDSDGESWHGVDENEEPVLRDGQGNDFDDDGSGDRVMEDSFLDEDPSPFDDEDGDMGGTTDNDDDSDD